MSQNGLQLLADRLRAAAQGRGEDADRLYEQAHALEKAAEDFGKADISPAKMLAEWGKARRLFKEVTGTDYMA